MIQNLPCLHIKYSNFFIDIFLNNSFFISIIAFDSVYKYANYSVVSLNGRVSLSHLLEMILLSSKNDGKFGVDTQERRQKQGDK